MKNILLVMSSSGYLVPPKQDPSQEKLWVETWKRIDRFLPDLKAELDLEGSKEKAAVVEQQQQQAEALASATPVS